MSRNNKIFYTERFNIDLFFRILFSGQWGSKVYILDSVDFFDHNTGKKTILEELSLKIFKKLSVVRVPFFQHATIDKKDKDICWVVNKKCLEFVESKHFIQHIDCVTSLMIRLTGDEKILIAMKKILLPYVYKKILFYYQLKLFTQQNWVLDKVYVNDLDFLHIEEYLGFDFVGNKSKESIWLAKISNLFLFLFHVFFCPLVMRDIYRRGLTFVNPKLRFYDTAIQVVWGFQTTHGLEKDKIKKRTIDDAEILKNKFLDSRKMLFFWDKLFGRNMSTVEYQENISHIHDLGASSLASSELRIPFLMFIKEYFRKGMVGFIFHGVVALMIRRQHSYMMAYAAQKVFLSYLQHDLFCQYIRAKVFISRDDYDFDHITRTIVQNKYNLINVGIQHSAFQLPEYIPFLAHSYFDRYYTGGAGFKGLWDPYWTLNKVIVPVGAQRDHCIYRAQQDLLVQNKFESKYGNQICLVMMITFPSNTYSPKWQLKRKYDGIQKLIGIDDRLHVILRPRSMLGIDEWLEMFPELKRCFSDGRISIQSTDFTTQELLAYSDIFVAEDASSALLESAYFSNLFTISLNIRYPAHKYLKGIAVENMDDLIEVINNYIKFKMLPKQMDNSLKQIKEKFTLDLNESSWTRIARDIHKVL
jgi:hypothetical protein